LDNNSFLFLGIDNLKKVYDSTPDFCDEKALDDVNRQLYEVFGYIKADIIMYFCNSAA